MFKNLTRMHNSSAFYSIKSLTCLQGPVKEVVTEPYNFLSFEKSLISFARSTNDFIKRVPPY